MSSQRADNDAAWPSLPYTEWLPTLTTLHMWTQVVGKVKLALTPFLNDWWNVTFSVSARGLTTGLIPAGQRVFQVDFDFIAHELLIRASDGQTRQLPLEPRSVADFHSQFMRYLEELQIQVKINPRPVEVDIDIPFPEDREHASYDPAYVNRWWRVLVSISRAMERYRTPFIGKSSPVQFWWGSFDLATSRYSGRPAPQRDFPARWMAIAATQESSLAGFWPGNARLTEPACVAYTSPEPQGCRIARIQPEPAYFHPELAEFILPYQNIRQAEDPEALVLEFYRRAYEIGASLGDWDRNALERPDPTAKG